ncbi:MAG: hypothetical protein ABFS56_11685 [Pseudomonadota bacterium]
MSFQLIGTQTSPTDYKQPTPQSLYSVNPCTSRLQLNHDLTQEFDSDLKHWNAIILKDNTVRFKAPKVLFESGKSKLRHKFKTILDDFFPRYVNILQRYRNDIEAIRIEGHTSGD